MKKLSVILAALLFAASLQAQSNLIARIHFLGGDRISTDPQSAAFTTEFCSPEARALENQTLDKLAKFFATYKPAGGADAAGQLHPLLDDLLKSEWILELRETPGSPDYALAVRLGPERAKLWNDNLQAVLRGLTGTTVPRVSRSGDWTVVDSGQNQLSLGPDAGGTNWLSVNLDWPRLAQSFPALREFDLPKIAFQVIGRDGYFRFNGKLNLAQPLASPGSWRMPTNSIHMPFVSFTAARGVGPWLAKQGWFRPYVLQPQPDQVFVWALPQAPFQTFIAEPVPDAKAAVAQLGRNLSGNADWRNQFRMPVTLRQTNNEIRINGLPPMAPDIRATHEAAQDFLVSGFFPNSPRSKPFPPEFFEQLNTPGLVYYHWELTGARLNQLPQFSQLLLMVTRHQQLGGQSAAHKWLARLGSTNDICVTYVTQTAPTELSLMRKSPDGLTAMELIALASWLESPKFPAFDLREPENPRMRFHLQQSAPSPLVPAGR